MTLFAWFSTYSQFLQKVLIINLFYFILFVWLSTFTPVSQKKKYLVIYLNKIFCAAFNFEG